MTKALKSRAVALLSFMASSASRRVVTALIVGAVAVGTKTTLDSEMVGNVLFVGTVIFAAVFSPLKTVEK